MTARLPLLLCLLGGCVLLEPAPHDTGPRYVSPGTHASSRAAASSSSQSSSGGHASSSLVPRPCLGRTIGCDGTVQLACDTDGGAPVQDCLALGQLCVPDVGCAACVPGTGACNGEQAVTCLPAGTLQLSTCDHLQGQSCNPETGRCQGACVTGTLGRSYIGCDYYPTVTANTVDDEFHFAVAVSNTTTQAAGITVTQGPNLLSTLQVAPNSVQLVTLPWRSELKGPAEAAAVLPMDTTLVHQGAYRLRSTQPVTVYQFNPLEYVSPTTGNFSYSNDASLLLPASAWTTNYFVAALPSILATPTSEGFYAVTAQQDGTTVTVTPGPRSGGTSAHAGIDATGHGQVTLQAGDVLEVFSGESPTDDVTGTLVASDKPVQVISGHQCTNVPLDTCCCDHIEESMFPMETLAKQYLVTAPLVPTLGATPKVELVRVVATMPGTTLVYDPPQDGAPSSIDLAGGWVEIAGTDADFGITANHPILVVQYMEGQDAGGETGDPAMALAVGVRQYRASYLFHAPINYEYNYLNVMAMTGSVVNLDGHAIAASAFKPVGGTGFGVARVALATGATRGNHSVTSTTPFGISVYGYGQYTSYWYPGGANLTDLLH